MLERFLIFDLRNFRLWSMGGGTLLILAAFLWTYSGGFSGDINGKQAATTFEAETAETESLQARVNEEGNLSIQVAPESVSVGRPILLGVSFTTHEGDLSFDLTQQAVLFDDTGVSYKPVNWSGGSGGHHLSGNLEFPALAAGTKQIKLVLYDLYGVEERVFEWTL